MARTLVHFDTHQSVKTLTESGIPEKQAEATVSVLSSGVANPDIATKQDIAESEARTAKLIMQLVLAMMGFNIALGAFIVAFG